MISRFILFVSLVIGVTSLAQIPFQDEKTLLYGFKDKTGKVVIQPVYHSVTPFSDGLSIVQEPLLGLYYTIDEKGFLYGKDV